MAQISWGKVGTTVKEKLLTHFLPLGLLLALLIGLTWPFPGKELNQLKSGDYKIISTINVVLIFFLQGLSLRTDEVKQAIRAWKAMSWGIFSIIAVTALTGFVLFELPVTPIEFRIGLAVFCVVPTTLTSGVTLVNQAKGNGALALMLTVVTNLLGIVTSPWWLKAIIRGSNSSVDAVDLLLKLLLTILLPVTVGKALRELIKPIQAFVKKHKRAISLTTNGLLIMIVWMSISGSASTIKSVAFGKIALIIAIEVIVHGYYLAMNFGACKVLRLNKQELRCVLLLASQKTLPVAITVISYLGDAGDTGLMALPCIVGHLSQLLIDSGIVTWWLIQDKKAGAAEDEEEELPMTPKEGTSQMEKGDIEMSQGSKTQSQSNGMYSDDANGKQTTVDDLEHRTQTEHLHQT
ncbi:unnamed protein product [Pedinophyceae sp. YPF-701]|nr:unnamed protein product [Pedinophyceae sp. YPF-701]